MKNITLKIDDETYRKARILAAERDTSLSAMVRDYLQSLSAETGDEARARRVAALKEIHAEAEARATPRTESPTPLTREEIYDERIR